MGNIRFADLLCGLNEMQGLYLQESNSPPLPGGPSRD